MDTKAEILELLKKIDDEEQLYGIKLIVEEFAKAAERRK